MYFIKNIVLITTLLSSNYSLQRSPSDSLIGLNIDSVLLENIIGYSLQNKILSDDIDTINVKIKADISLGLSEVYYFNNKVVRVILVSEFDNFISDYFYLINVFEEANDSTIKIKFISNLAGISKNGYLILRCNPADCKVVDDWYFESID